MHVMGGARATSADRLMNQMKSGNKTECLTGRR